MTEILYANPGKKYLTSNGKVCVVTYRKMFAHRNKKYHCEFINKNGSKGDGFYVDQYGKHETENPEYTLQERLK